MFNLDKNTDENVGGGIKVMLIDADDIDVFPVPGNYMIDFSDITLAGGGSWFTWLFKPSQVMFKEEAPRKGDVSLFAPVITGWIPKDRPDILSYLLKMEKRKYVALFFQHNKITVDGDEYPACNCVGSKLEPCTFAFSRSAGKVFTDPNGYEFTFSVSRRTASPFVLT